MQYTKPSSITTETKVALGILALTGAIIFGGVLMFKGNTSTTVLSDDTVMRNIDTGLSFTKEKVSPLVNPKITGTGPGTSTSTATTTIEVTEFMDYECPACANQGETIVKELLARYGSRIVITRRVFPVHGAPSIDVARMVLAAQDTSIDAYQKLHTKVLETQNDWARLGKTEREGFFRNITKDIGLDYDTLVALGKSKYASQIDTDKADAIDLGIKATPSFVVNNTTRITGGIPLEYFDRFVNVR
jgi:protein-disulfide isomerase